MFVKVSVLHELKFLSFFRHTDFCIYGGVKFCIKYGVVNTEKTEYNAAKKDFPSR